MAENCVIAIDGPSASGKSTVARRVAAALGMLYVDSGAVYRGVTYHVLQEGADTSSEEQTVAALRRMPIEFSVDSGAVVFAVNGVRLVSELRGQDVTQHVSPVAAVPEVRRQVTDWLRDMRGFGGLVMEGRDIGTAVFPDAGFKFYLDASAEERARRRHAEGPGAGGEASVEDVSESLKRRDRIDSTRATAPLKVADGSVIVDTTGMSIDEVVGAIVAHVRDYPVSPRIGA